MPALMPVSRRSSVRFVLGFFSGIAIGMTLCIILANNWNWVITDTRVSSDGNNLILSEYDDEWKQELQNRQDNMLPLKKYGDFRPQDPNHGNLQDLQEHHDDDTVARTLKEKVRVLIWILTSPKNLDKKAVHVRNTWAKHSDKVLFMSSQWNNTFPTIGLNVSEGRQHLTDKTMQAFNYVYQHHFDNADWFMKTDDDTYVVVENLRYMLSNYNANEPIYFGHTFKTIVKGGYASGGAGYVLSKESLRRLATRGVGNGRLCRQQGGAEDAEVGKCLQRLGVKIRPSVDRLGRSRFHCFGPETHLQAGFPEWYFHYDANGAKKGMDTVSDYPISFHYISPAKMYALEFFVYHMRPYGIISKIQHINVNE